MLKTRLLTASVLVVSLLAVCCAPRVVWQVLSVGLIVLSGLEWSHLLQLRARAKALLMLSLSLAMLAHITALFDIHSVTWLAMVWWLLALVCLRFYTAPLLQHWFWQRYSQALFILVGLIVLLSAWLMLWTLPINHILLLIASVGVADSAAYFVGRRYGRHLLAPHISPQKTWEGVLGALLGLSGLTSLWVYRHDGNYIHGLLFAGAVVSLSVLGDLFESALKRRAGLKDSGNILPGHGGLLDRIDGLLPVLAYAPFILKLIV